MRYPRSRIGWLRPKWGAAVTDTVPNKTANNRLVAEKLDEVADLLKQQQANPFRINAYRDAAAYVARLPTPISDVLAEGGLKALVDLPTIGQSIAALIIEILDLSRFSAAPSARLSHLSFESDWAFPSEC